MFLLRDEKLGTRVVTQLPANAFPWAVNAAGQVVYVEVVDTVVPRYPINPPLKPYTSAVSINRRRLCQTELADLALHRRQLTNGAVLRVSLGVISYIQQQLSAGKTQITAEIAACIQKYMFSNAGYGRLGQPKDKPAGEDECVKLCYRTLTEGSLPSVLAIHDFMGRIVFAKLKGTPEQEAVFNRVGSDVRPAYMFGARADPPEKMEQLRGRTARKEGDKTSTAPGVLSSGESYVPLASFQERERGIDRWEPTQTQLPQFTIDVQQRNLVFGAGPSGSTGTLLQAGILFGKLDAELLKQYVLAIVGYLVGGGMHSYHEVMTIARMTGCPYVDGTYEASLPTTFLTSLEGQSWRSRYYDIVVLGRRLWNLPQARNIGRLSPERLQQAEATIFEWARLQPLFADL